MRTETMAGQSWLLSGLSVIPDSLKPMDCGPPGSSVNGILQAGTLEWVAIPFSNAWNCKVKVKILSCVRLLATPWTAAYQAPPSIGLSRQEYWSGLPLPLHAQLIPPKQFLSCYPSSQHFPMFFMFKILLFFFHHALPVLFPMTSNASKVHCSSKLNVFSSPYFGLCCLLEHLSFQILSLPSSPKSNPTL